MKFSLLLLLVVSAASQPVDLIDGPARESPVLDSDLIKAEDLPMEHRIDVTGPIVLPNRTGVDEAVYQRLGVDLFFSLWFVFLNNDVQISGERV